MNIEMLIHKLKNQASSINAINDETTLTNIVKQVVNGNSNIECSVKYPCIDNKKCDLMLKHTDNAAKTWIEIKDNITLLPFGDSKIIYEQNKLIFLDIARLIVGVNSNDDARVVISNIDKSIVKNYYHADPDNIFTTCFTAEDILPASANRRIFIEMKFAAKIEMSCIECNETYLVVFRILDGYVNLLVYKHLEDKHIEGESQKISFIETDFDKKEEFIKKYFPAS